MPTPAAPVTGKPSTSEIGYVSAAPTWGQLGRSYLGDDGEETAAVCWPESNRTYGRMRVNSTVATVLAALTQPILRPGVFAIDPQGADPAKVALIAEDFDLPILGTERPPPLRRRGGFSWLEHARLALLCRVYGHMAFELLCHAEALKATGQARLAKLAPRFPSTIADIAVSRDGGLESITQWRTANEPAKPIPVASLLWYAANREGATWTGRSDLRACYGDWLLLDRLLRVRAMLMERQGMGTPIGEAPEGASQDVIDLMGTLASQARAGDQSGIGIPHGARLRMVGVEGTLPDISAAIADHKAALADAVMAAHLRLGTAESAGNRALGQTFVDQFTQAEDAKASAIADTATIAVERIWDWNWGETDPAPAIVAMPIDAERDIDPASLVELVKVGAVTPDDSIEDFLRQRYRLPKRTPPTPDDPLPMAAEELATRVDAAGALVRSGFDPDSALVAVGLDPIAHLGLLPITLQSQEAAEAVPVPAGVAASAIIAARRARSVAAGRRRASRHPAAVTAKGATWAEKVAGALSATVDAEAIATAALEGTEPATAVAAGLSTDDTAALSAVLVAMWGEGYGAGAKRATKVAAGRLPAGSVHRSATPYSPGQPVMASLADMVARAEEIAKGVLGSLADRLASVLGGDEDVPQSKLEELLAGAAADEAAAERIAATEYHRSVTTGAVDTWAAMGITETEWVRVSGSAESDVCQERDGQTSAEWSGLPPLHPNCACLLLPVLPVAAAAPAPEPDHRAEERDLQWTTLVGAVTAMASREPAAPTVTVSPPSVTVESPHITVETPAVSVTLPGPPPAPKAVAARARARRVERDAAGNIIRIVEE